MQTHEASWICLVSAYFAIHFHQSLVDDLFDFIVRQSILQTVAQEHSKRQALTKLVWTTAWTRCLSKFHTSFTVIIISILFSQNESICDQKQRNH